MAASQQSPRRSIDVGALEQRVYGTERKIDDLSTQTTTQIGSMRTEFVSLLNGLSTKMDAGRVSGLAIWTAAAGGATLLVGVVTIIGSMAISPVHEDITRLEHVDKGFWSKEAQTEYEKRIDDRYKMAHEQFIREMDDVKLAARTIDGNQIKRPEIQSQFDSDHGRIDAVSARLNEVGRQLEALSPTSDVIKELQTSVRELRQAQPPLVVPHADH